MDGLMDGWKEGRKEGIGKTKEAAGSEPGGLVSEVC